MTGDIIIGYDPTTDDKATPVAGGTWPGDDIFNLAGAKSFIGSVYDTGNDLGWQNIISIRHRNGASDGLYYGMYIRTALTNNNDSLVYNRQISGNWQDERTIIDSANLDNYLRDRGLI